MHPWRVLTLHRPRVLKVKLMAEVLLTFPDPILDDHGHAYVARVCGRQGVDGRWEGWIEFVPGDGGPVMRTERETTQPKRSDLQYWASGLTSTYMEGALERVLHPGPHPVPSVRDRAVPSYEGPAPTSAATATDAPIAATRQPPYPHAVLDPFSVFAQGEAVLRQQLGALGTDHLHTIVRAHSLVGEHEVDLHEMQHATLVDLIVAAVRKRAT
jgi:hypothetical protein